MRWAVLSLLLLVLAAACTRDESEPPPPRPDPVAQRFRYEQIYHHYRALIAPAVRTRDIDKLRTLSADFVTACAESVVWISVLQRDQEGDWQPLLEQVYHPARIELPIEPPHSRRPVLFSEGARTVVCESGRVDGRYPDGLHIRIVYARRNI